MGCTGPSGLQVKQSSYKKTYSQWKLNEHDEPNVGRLHEAPQDQNRSRQFSCRPANKLTKVLLMGFIFKTPFYFLEPFSSTFLAICTETSLDLQSLTVVRRDVFLVNSSQIQRSNQSCYISLNQDLSKLFYLPSGIPCNIYQDK